MKILKVSALFAALTLLATPALAKSPVAVQSPGLLRCGILISPVAGCSVTEKIVGGALDTAVLGVAIGSIWTIPAIVGASAVVGTGTALGTGAIVGGSVGAGGGLLAN